MLSKGQLHPSVISEDLRNYSFVTLAIVIFITLFSLEIFLFNSDTTQYILSGVRQVTYPVTNFVAKGYEIDGSTIISRDDDATLQYSDINRLVRQIEINCLNENKESASKGTIVYSKGDKSGSLTSVPFDITSDTEIVDLRTPIFIRNLTISLTNKIGDSFVCENITLNPKPSFQLSIGRLAFYFGLLLLIVISLKKTRYNKTVFVVEFGSSVHWLFSGLVFVLDLFYPLIATWDSGDYLELTHLLTSGNLAYWDPVRNVLFPFQLYLNQLALGLSSNSFLIPLILAHCALYLLCCEIAYRIFKPQNIYRFWISFTIFMLIALDPTIIGYFHTLLTEYIAAFVAILSCFMAMEFYTSKVGSRIFYGTIVYFCVFVPIMWHVKQPYIGAALFPYLIAGLLKIIKSKSTKLTAYCFTSLIVIVLLTVSSQIAWTNLLQNSGNLMDEERLLSVKSERMFQKQTEEIMENPIEFLKKKSANYLVASNYFVRNIVVSSKNGSRTPFISQAFQNQIIAHKIFFLDNTTSNLFHAPPYQQYVEFLRFTGATPEYIDRYFISRSYLSNIFFSTGFLILPFYLILSIVLWLKHKDFARTVIIVLLGTAFLNAVAHTTFGDLDRYFFFGYPLILLAYIIDLTSLVLMITRGKNNVVSTTIQDQEPRPVTQ